MSGIRGCSMSRNSLRQIVTRCRRGSDEAWDELLDHVRPVVFSICRQSGLSSEECLDIFGQVSYMLVTRIDEVTSPERILSYVATATRRRISNLFRASKFVRHLDLGSLDIPSNSPSERPDAVHEFNRRVEALRSALLRLSPREKELITALFLERDQPDYKAVAERLGMPVSSVGPTRARTLEKLRRILMKAD